MNTIPERSAASVPEQNRTSHPDAKRMFSSLRDEVESRLDHLVPVQSALPTKLHDIMRYSLLGGGKRVRASLSILISEAAGNRGRAFAMEAGCAIEMVHAASLILDDLPCMDAATMRRGRQATHMKFGTASSILASVGLLNRAFEIIAEFPETDDQTKAASIRALTKAVGTDGMITGQDIDLHKRDSTSDIANVEGVNWLKTGVLFCTAAEMGAIAAGLDKKATDDVKLFSTHVGLAFQTVDDLIDQEATMDIAGKDVLQDVQKPTLVSLIGAAGARLTCQEHLDIAREALLESGLDPTALNALLDGIFAEYING